MNKELRELFDNNNIITKKITIKNNVRIIDSGEKKFVIKRKEKDINDIYKYLRSRSFDFYPDIMYQTTNYDIYKYVDSTDISREEKAEDIIKLITILHSKTTFYKKEDDNDYKEIYESIIERLDYLVNYYNDITEVIEHEVYMSPRHYYFIRNVSKVFASLDFCRYHIDKWYKLIEDKKRIRVVQLHNNLDLDHYLVSDNKPYLISWRRSKRDIPIYDLISMYKKYYKEFDFCELVRRYEMSYPLLPEEKELFFVLISIPEKLEFNNNEYNMCINVNKFYDYLLTSERLIEDYMPKESISN